MQAIFFGNTVPAFNRNTLLCFVAMAEMTKRKVKAAKLGETEVLKI